MAHRCVDYRFVNAPPLYLPRRYAIANARICPDALPLPREWRLTGHVWHLHVLLPNKGIWFHLIRTRSITDRTNLWLSRLVIRFVRDRYARQNGRGC